MRAVGTVYRTNDGREWVWKPDYGELYEIVEKEVEFELVEHTPVDEECWSWDGVLDYWSAVAS